jgi:hypothetical protein
MLRILTLALPLFAQIDAPTMSRTDHRQCNPTVQYPHTEHIAHISVTPHGSILQYPVDGVDENDIVVVHVFAPEDELDDINVGRRQPGEVTAIGRGVIRLQAYAPCGERTVTVGDFAPGRADIDIYTMDGGTKTITGSFAFNVKNTNPTPPKDFSEALVRLFWETALGRGVLFLIIFCMAVFAVWKTLPDATKTQLIKKYSVPRGKKRKQSSAEQTRNSNKTA